MEPFLDACHHRSWRLKLVSSYDIKPLSVISQPAYAEKRKKKEFQENVNSPFGENLKLKYVENMFFIKDQKKKKKKKTAQNPNLAACLFIQGKQYFLLFI